ncbi:MAG: FkbM family methyltransferase [Methylovirgula sp.]|uniref:FkbM family methyltransferase n=1 Tax=Methylovirgula sp. TaxID=1978224 RepID=UPI0030763435
MVGPPSGQMSFLNNLLKNSFLGRKLDEIAARLAALDEVRARLAAVELKLDRLEIFSHGARATYVGGNRVLTKTVVADRQIAYLVEADDRLLSPWFIVAGGYETELTNFFVSALKPGSHCIDVGANFGYFTGLMARFCPQGRVIGIEPDAHVFELARDNIFINGFGHAEVIHAAAGKHDFELTLHRRNTRSANTSIAKLPAEFIESMGEAPSEPFTVKCIPIDDLLPRLGGRVDFMKIDVEGAEPLVFEGAEKTIAANPQIRIVVEWSPGQLIAAGFEVSSYLSSLESMGLMPFDIEPDGSLKALSFEELSQLPYRAGVVLKRPD